MAYKCCRFDSHKFHKSFTWGKPFSFQFHQKSLVQASHLITQYEKVCTQALDLLSWMFLLWITFHYFSGSQGMQCWANPQSDRLFTSVGVAGEKEEGKVIYCVSVHLSIFILVRRGDLPQTLHDSEKSLAVEQSFPLEFVKKFPLPFWLWHRALLWRPSVLHH